MPLILKAQLVCNFRSEFQETFWEGASLNHGSVSFWFGMQANHMRYCNTYCKKKLTFDQNQLVSFKFNATIRPKECIKLFNYTLQRCRFSKKKIRYKIDSQIKLLTNKIQKNPVHLHFSSNHLSDRSALANLLFLLLSRL